MRDGQANLVKEAVLNLAVVIRDEGMDAVVEAARIALKTAGDDPVAALCVAAALIDTEAPVNEWWNRPAVKQCTSCRRTKPCSDFRVDRSRSDGLSYRCKDCINHSTQQVPA